MSKTFSLELTRDEIDLLKVGLTSLVLSKNKIPEELREQFLKDIENLVPKLVAAHKSEGAFS